MDFELTEDQRAFADTARAFAEAEFAPQRQVLGKAAASTGSMAPNTYVRADAARAKVLREEGDHHGHSRQRRG